MDTSPLLVLEELESAGKQLCAALDLYLGACSRVGDLLSSVLHNVPQKHLHCISKEIARAHTCESSIVNARITLNQARNRFFQFTPISSLPSEILGHIFHLVAAPCDLKIDKENYSYGSELTEVTNSETGNSDDIIRETRIIGQPGRYDNPKALIFENFPTHLDSVSRVCSYWRQLSINMPSLWTHIDFYPHESLYQGFLARAEAYVARSDKLPIELHVADIEPFQYRQEPFLQLLLSIRDRIKSLNITITHSWRRFHTLILDRLFPEAAPVSTILTKLTTSHPLASLQVDCFIDWFEDDHDGFSNLTILHLHGMFPIWESTAYHNLVDLRLASPSDTCWVSIPEPQFRRILEASPGLRVLHFSLRLKGRGEGKSTTPVRLNSLEEVGISTYRGDEKAILQPGHVLRLLAPGSKPLRLSICHRPLDGEFDEYEVSLWELVEFFRRSNIVEFFAKYSYPPLDRLLCFAPSIEQLALNSCVVEGKGDFWTLPERHIPTTFRLKTLILHRCSPYLEHLKALLDRYHPDLLILSECDWVHIEGSSDVCSPVRHVLKLLEGYPAIRHSFQSSDPTPSWDLIY